MQRTAAIKGKTPLLVVAPYGCEDTNTATIVEHIQKELDCFAVINYMWEKSPQYDYDNSKADCHHIQQCLQDVVRQEYLDWIVKFRDMILNIHHTANIFYIRGCDNVVRKQANKDLDIILGYGASLYPSYTCEMMSRNALIHVLNKQGFLTYMGKADGLYCARLAENMTQIFRTIFAHNQVESYELHVVRSLRYDKIEAQITADLMANALEDFIEEQERNDSVGYSFPLNTI